MNNDLELVRQYAANGSEEAFEALVSRHIGLVYSAALRQVHNAALAGEITQTVFIILSRKAGSLGPKTILPGWLYRTTRYVSSASLKMQHRRARREQEAQMQIAESPTDSTWEQLAPLLDEAMAQLRDKDRDSIVLRYFQNKSLKEVGAAIGVNEYAAQKRVARGLEKLRAFFTKRGVTSTTAIIAGIISANSIQAAPAALSGSISTVALAKGATASTSTLALVKAALNIMAWARAKTAVAISSAVALTAGTATLAVHLVSSPVSSSGSQLSDIFNSLLAAQHKEAGHIFNATAEITEITPRKRNPEDYTPSPTNTYATRECHLTVGFFPWGYAAGQTVISNFATRAALDNWYIYSNDFSEEVDTFTNPTSHRPYLEGKNVEVLVYPGFKPEEFEIDPFNIYTLYNTLTNLDNLKVVPSTNSPGLLTVEGTWNLSPHSKEKFRIAFDPAHKLFPVEGEIYLDGKLLNQWQGMYVASNDNQYFPQSFSMKVLRNNVPILSHTVTDISDTIRPSGASALLQGGEIPHGAIVSEYRFSRPFAYVEGVRSPTPVELSEMATNSLAIRQYQMSALSFAPLRPPKFVPQTHERELLITTLIVLAGLGCSYLFIKMRHAD